MDQALHQTGRGQELAAEGCKTLVLEQADFVGGCDSSFEADGYRFDVGACIIEMVRAHDWFYQRLGLNRKDSVRAATRATPRSRRNSSP